MMIISTEPTLGIRLVLLISPERKAFRKVSGVYLALALNSVKPCPEARLTFPFRMKAVNF